MGTKKRILVLGATGRIGGELVRLLSQEAIQVRVLIRNEKKRAELEDLGCEVFIGDAKDEEAVLTALKEVDKLFLLYPDRPHLFEVEKSLIDAAVQMNVQHIVKLSAYVAGLTPPISFGVLHAKAEAYLQQSGVAWTILRPYAFMQNVLFTADAVVKGGVLPGPFKNGKISFIDSRDVAVVAKNTLLEVGHEGQIYELTGPEPITYHDMTAKLSELLGRRIRYVSLPIWVVGFIMRRQGLSAWEVKQFKILARLLRKDGEKNVTHIIQTVGKQKPRDFESFVKDHLDFFQP